MTHRIRALQLALTAWAVLLLVHAAYVFTRPRAALDRWAAIQVEAVSRGATRTVEVEHGIGSALGVDMFAFAVIGIAVVALMLALVWRAGHLAEARLLALFLAMLQMPGIVLEAVGISRSTYVVVGSGFLYIAIGAFLRFAGTFPRPLLPDEIAAKRAWARALQRACLRPWAVWGGAGVLALASVAAAATGGPLAGMITIAAFVPILVGVSLLRRSHQVAAPAERRRILWIVQGFYAAAWVIGLGYTAGMVITVRDGIGAALEGSAAVSSTALLTMNLTSAVAILVLLCALAFAVFYHGAIEPGMVIQKTTVYGILTVLGAASFGVVESLASDVLLQTAGLPDSWGGPIAGAVMAGAVTLLRPRVAGWVGRRFPAAGVVAPA